MTDFVTKLTAHGGVADARQVADAVMMADSPLLTSPSAAFTAEDVGRTVVVASAGPSQIKLRTTIDAIVSPTEATLAVSAATTVVAAGATIGTDCSAALQSALDALAANGGGGVLIDGAFLLTQPVACAFDAQASAVRMLGLGSASRLYIGCGEADAAIDLSTAEQLLIEGIVFVGTPFGRNLTDVPLTITDAKIVLSLRVNQQTQVRDCGFYGLSSLASADGCIILFDQCSSRLVANKFGGCATNSGVGSSVVAHTAWRAVYCEANDFFDHGQLGPITHLKPNVSLSLAWIRVNAPQIDTASNILMQSVVVIQRDRYDEGALTPVLIQPPSNLRVDKVRIDGCRHNCGTADGENGYTVKRATDVLIRNCYSGYAGTANSYGFVVENCTTVEVDGFSVAGNVVKAKALTVINLLLLDCPGLTTIDRTGVANFVKTTRAAQYLGLKSGELGPELLVNGDFSDGTTGWSAFTGGTISNVGGKLRVTTAGGIYSKGYQILTLGIGLSYRISLEILGPTAGSRVYAGFAPNGANLGPWTASGTYEFTATHTTTYIGCQVQSEVQNVYCDFDNISVRQIF